MTQRIDYAQAFPEAIKAMAQMEATLRHSGLEKPLLELVKLRASQLNGCAYCIDMHTKDARAGGETEQRLYGLTAWRESPFFTPRERAALAWTEAITNIQEGHATQTAYDEARKEFEEGRAGEAHLCHHHDQYLEPHRDRLSPRSRRLQAGKIAPH